MTHVLATGNYRETLLNLPQFTILSLKLKLRQRNKQNKLRSQHLTLPGVLIDFNVTGEPFHLSHNCLRRVALNLK